MVHDRRSYRNVIQSTPIEFNHCASDVDTQAHPFASTISPDMLQVYFSILQTPVTPYIKSNAAPLSSRE